MKNEYPDIFSEFCAKKASRYAINHPWTKSGVMYATDGQRAIRKKCDLPDDMEEGAKYPPVDSVFPKLSEYTDVPAPSGSLRLRLVECRACNGRGVFGCDCPRCPEGQTHECETCAGKGKEEDRSHQVVFGRCCVRVAIVKSLVEAGATFKAHATKDFQPVYALLPDGTEAVVMPTQQRTSSRSTHCCRTAPRPW